MVFKSARQRKFVMGKLRNREVAESFAQGKQAKGSNLFTEDDTIYSYGHHFPIAKRLSDGTYLFTKQGRSMTTSRHKNFVKNALQGQKIVMVDKID